MSAVLQGRMVIPGTASGRILAPGRPISFWGDVDPESGHLFDPSGGPGTELAGRVLVLAETRGSSGSSGILLELLGARIAPAAIVLVKIDAILVLGAIVAREMGWPTIPILAVDAAVIDRLGDGCPAVISADGAIRVEG